MDSIPVETKLGTKKVLMTMYLHFLYSLVLLVRELVLVKWSIRCCSLLREH